MSRLVEPDTALDESVRLARQIAASGPLAVRASRHIVLSAAHLDDDTLRQRSDELLREMFASEDFTEGMAAFIEKRPPQWKGR